MPTSPRRVEFLFDIVSPAAYLVLSRLPALARETGAEIDYVPVLLGGVFQGTGNAPPLAVPAKGAYARTDFLRFAARQKLPMVFSEHFPVKSITAMRVLAGAKQSLPPARFVALVDALFDATWRDGKNTGETDVLAQAIADAGFDAPALLAAAGQDAAKGALRAATDRAVARGAFGVPTFFVGEDMFFGQDRLDFVRDALLEPAA